MPKVPCTAAIVVRGEPAGQAEVRFTGAGLASADHALRTDLLLAIAGAAGLAALLAMLTALAVARRITRPVEKIITVTRAMARGQRTARVGPVTGPGELRELAAAADGLAGRFEAAGITLQRQLPAAQILADPRWLHQVITNLLTNALKFTPAGGRVTIATESAGTRAVLTITDTDTGIPADELPRIFDRFWRGRQASQTSGSGIGLALAAELTQAHGGRLSA